MTEEPPVISRKALLRQAKQPGNEALWNALVKARISRRSAIAKMGAVAVGAAAVIAGGGGYYAGTLATPPTGLGGTQTVTSTVTSTATQTLTQTITGPPPGAVELNFYTTGHSGFYYDQKAFKPIETYGRISGVKVNTLVDSFFAIHDKMATTFAAGVYGWDVAYIWAGILSEFLDHFTPLDELGITIPKEVDEDIVPYSKAAVSFKGRYYGLPRMFEIFNLLANKDVLDAKGLPFPTTMEELFEACEAVHDPANGVYAFGSGWQQGYLQPHYCVFLHANGGKLFANDAQQSVVCDSPESIKAVEDMAFLYENYMDPGAIEKIADVQVGAEWLSGRYVFDVWYPNHAFVPLDPESKVKNLYVWLFPGHQGVVRSGSEVAAEGYGIPRTARSKQEAWRLIQWLSSRESQVQMYLSNDWTVPGQEPAPTYWSYFDDARFKVEPFRSTLLAQLEQATYDCSRYERPAFVAVITVLEAEIVNALTKQKTAEDAMKDAREVIDPLIAEEFSKFGGGYYDPWQDMQRQMPRLKSLIQDLRSKWASDQPFWFPGGA